MESLPRTIPETRQKRAELLGAMYDLCTEQGGDLYQTLSLLEAGKRSGLDEWVEMWATASYLAKAGFIEVEGGGVTGRMMAI